MQISIEVQGVSKVGVFLEAFPRATGTAILRALKRGTDAAATRAGRVVSQDMGLKVSDVRKRIRVTPPNGETLFGQLSAKLKRVPLIEFPSKRGSGGPHAFTATMPKSGHRGIFVRRPLESPRRGKPPNRSGLPIQQLFGPSVGRVMIKHQSEISSVGQNAFLKELDRLLDRIIQGNVAVGDA